MNIGAVDRSDRWMRVLVIAWALVGVGLLLMAAGWLIGKVSGALVPFVLALLIVLVFRRPVDLLEKRGMKRGFAVLVCYLAGAAVAGVVLGFLVPALAEQIRQFVVAFPDYYGKAAKMFLQLQDKYQALVVPGWVDNAIVNIQDTVSNQSARWSTTLAKEVFSVGGSAITFLGHALLAMVVGFWVLKDLPAIRREAILLAGPKREEEAAMVSSKVSRILSGYLRGQMVLSLSTGTLVAIGLTAFGIPYSLVIGVFAGVLNLIPWIGPALTAVIAGIAAAFVSPWHVVAAVGVEMAAQQLTEIFVQPRVMSQQVDLHPVLVIFSLLAGSTLFGFTGLVLAIPVAAVAKGLFVYYFEKYTDSKLTSADGALFRAPDGERGDCPAPPETCEDDVTENDRDSEESK